MESMMQRNAPMAAQQAYNPMFDPSQSASQQQQQQPQQTSMGSSNLGSSSSSSNINPSSYAQSSSLPGVQASSSNLGQQWGTISSSSSSPSLSSELASLRGQPIINPQVVEKIKNWSNSCCQDTVNRIRAYANRYPPLAALLVTLLAAASVPVSLFLIYAISSTVFTLIISFIGFSVVQGMLLGLGGCGLLFCLAVISVCTVVGFVWATGAYLLYKGGAAAYANISRSETGLGKHLREAKERIQREVSHVVHPSGISGEGLGGTGIGASFGIGATPGTSTSSSNLGMPTAAGGTAASAVSPTAGFGIGAGGSSSTSGVPSTAASSAPSSLPGTRP